MHSGSLSGGEDQCICFKQYIEEKDGIWTAWHQNFWLLGHQNRIPTLGLEAFRVWKYTKKEKRKKSGLVMMTIQSFIENCKISWQDMFWHCKYCLVVLWRRYFYIIVHYQLLPSHTSFSIFRQMLIEGAGRPAGSTSAAT